MVRAASLSVCDSLWYFELGLLQWKVQSEELKCAHWYKMYVFIYLRTSQIYEQQLVFSRIYIYSLQGVVKNYELPSLLMGIESIII